MPAAAGKAPRRMTTAALPATLRIDNLVVKIAEFCNLRCQYCYLYEHGDTTYKQRPHFMSDAVFEGLLESVRRYCDARPGQQTALTFHGGEPTLVGTTRLCHLAERARAVLGPRLSSLQMQSNGTLIDAQWVRALRSAQVHTSISLDGPPDIHDRHRTSHNGQGSHAAAVRGIRILQEAGLRPGVLAVVAPGADGARVYRHFRELGLDSIDLLIPDVTHDTRDAWYGSCGPFPLASYLIPAFDAWFDEDNPSVVVRLFYGLLRRMLGGPMTSDAFGNPLVSYLIVDTDGSIQPNDALRICENGMTQTMANVCDEGFDNLASKAPLAYQLLTQGVPLSATCQACDEVNVCGGGYLPHRYSRANRFDNPSVWCDDIKLLLAHLRSRTSLPLATAPVPS
jgi:uncharacterized protein